MLWHLLISQLHVRHIQLLDSTPGYCAARHLMAQRRSLRSPGIAPDPTSSPRSFGRTRQTNGKHLVLMVFAHNLSPILVHHFNMFLHKSGTHYARA